MAFLLKYSKMKRIESACFDSASFLSTLHLFLYTFDSIFNDDCQNICLCIYVSLSLSLSLFLFLFLLCHPHPFLKSISNFDLLLSFFPLGSLSFLVFHFDSNIIYLLLFIPQHLHTRERIRKGKAYCIERLE